VKRVLIAGLATLLAGCGVNLPVNPTIGSPPHISKPNSTGVYGMRIDGGATFRAVVGERSTLDLSYISWPSRVMVIDFAGDQNWIDHHADVHLIPSECTVEQSTKRIICVFPYPVTGGLNVDGVATDPGTFHYSIRFSDQPSDSPHWVTDPDGALLLRAWDETVARP
jgi:hypothetical protein